MTDRVMLYFLPFMMTLFFLFIDYLNYETPQNQLTHEKAIKHRSYGFNAKYSNYLWRGHTVHN